MSGEALALLSALFYGAASVAIARGRTTNNNDNGFMLSVLLTVGVSGFIWGLSGQVQISHLSSSKAGWGLAVFAAAGMFSIVLGRLSLYRATESIGAVRASLFRRLTPVFALLFAFLIFGSIPGAGDLVGGVVVLIAVLVFMRPSSASFSGASRGYVWALGSAAFYAMSYSLRSLGLDSLPDPAFGTFVGAITGAVVMIVLECTRHGVRKMNERCLKRNNRWQWMAALSLSFGQTLQFYALGSASVPVVAVLGTLEVIFAAGLAAGLGIEALQSKKRLVTCVVLAAMGTALLVW